MRGKQANGLGLYDLHGNVWEWCLDVWDADAYKKRPDGVVDSPVRTGDAGQAVHEAYRVIRGGSWYSSARKCHSASRDGWNSGNRGSGRGFRICINPETDPFSA
ncbi:MAG: SUMF1/EgtB/PvdO family nonheme iron enzyme [Planctomycetaceae bacterium]|nr:SUMF1/EgtB/PvdO family nonheme iron enzyme [Planctomycetaceae bacterium]